MDLTVDVKRARCSDGQRGEPRLHGSSRWLRGREGSLTDREDEARRQGCRRSRMPWAPAKGRHDGYRKERVFRQDGAGRAMR